MLIALAVTDWWQRIHRSILGQLIKRSPQEQVVDERIRRQGKMVPVLFDSRRGEHKQSFVLRERLNLLPVQISELPFIGNPRMHLSPRPEILVLQIPTQRCGWLCHHINSFKRHHLAWVH